MAGRKVSALSEHSSNVCVDHSFDWTADFWDDLDSSNPKPSFELMADPPTDDDIHAAPPESHDTAVVFDALVGYVLDGAVAYVENAEVLGHVEDG